MKESSQKKTCSEGFSLVNANNSSHLPKEIVKKKYDSERELHMDLEKFGVGDDDLQIIPNQDGFPIWREMPSEEHRAVIQKVMKLFDVYKNNSRCLQIKGEKTGKVFINDSFSHPKKEKHCPDFAIFGPDRVEGRHIRTVGKYYMNPHVIIVFSWTNNDDIVKEAAAFAVDDMMNHAGMGDYISLGRPNVAYLIKAMRRGSARNSPVYGFNVFQVEQDQSTPEEPTMKYRCGVQGQEDTVISITPAAMGLLGNDDAGEPFEIRMSDIRVALARLNVVFVPALENEM